MTPVSGRLLETVGTLYLYEFRLPPDGVLAIDIPVSIVPDDEMEPTEGLVLSCKDGVALVQTFDAIGTTVTNATIVPDRGGFLLRAAERFARHVGATRLLSTRSRRSSGSSVRDVELGFDQVGGSDRLRS